MDLKRMRVGEKIETAHGTTTKIGAGYYGFSFKGCNHAKCRRRVEGLVARFNVILAEKYVERAEKNISQAIEIFARNGNSRRSQRKLKHAKRIRTQLTALVPARNRV